MDNVRLEMWISKWYAEIKKKSSGPWCLLIDNCGGHETPVTLPGVKIVYLQPRSTTKHQPLDLGIIVNAKILYRSALLAATIDVLQGRSSSNLGLKMNSGHGKCGFIEGQLPHVCDPMNLFNQSWDSIHRVSIMKCWMKSDCLTQSHLMKLNSLVFTNDCDIDVDIDLTSTKSDNNLDSDDIIGYQVVRAIKDGLTDYQNLLNPPQTPLNDIVREFERVEGQSDLMNVQLKLQMTILRSYQLLFRTEVKNGKNLKKIPMTCIV